MTHYAFKHLGLFDAHVPRYTSYPPANHFDTLAPSQSESWLKTVPRSGHIAIYVHIPYCRRLCWFCADHTHGLMTDRPLRRYLDHILAELALIAGYLPPDVRVASVHLGGGTPTILSAEMLSELGQALRDFRPFTRTARISVEIDPAAVDDARLDALAQIGMNRAAIGVQGFDPRVQTVTGRVQPFAVTRKAVAGLRARGVGCVTMDVLYGLPYQTPDSMTQTIEKVMDIRPDRLALFGHGHAPLRSRRQVMIEDAALPDPQARLALFEAARRQLLDGGYHPVGIDHFCLPGDSLAFAAEIGSLRRNFQGYTEENADALIGIGASSISRFAQGYAQNVAAISDYGAHVAAGRLPTARGHRFTSDDLLRGAMIEELLCNSSVDIATHARRFDRPIEAVEAIVLPLLSTFHAHLVKDGSRIELIGPARHLARMAAQTMDAYVAPEGRHSRAI